MDDVGKDRRQVISTEASAAEAVGTFQSVVDADFLYFGDLLVAKVIAPM